MKNTHQRIIIIIHVIFSIFCLIHVLGIGINLMFPTNANIRIEQKDLKEIEFPLAFKICVDQDINKDSIESYRKFGYSSWRGFFRGESRFNESILGWNGHTRNNSILGTVKG